MPSHHNPPCRRHSWGDRARSAESLERRFLLCAAHANPAEAPGDPGVATVQPLLHPLVDVGSIAARRARVLRAAGADVWSGLDAIGPAPRTGAIVGVEVIAYSAFTINAAQLKQRLSSAPMEFTAGAATNALTLAIPAPDGSLKRFRIVEAPVMAPALAARFQDIKTYRGQGIDDPAATIRLDYTPAGFHAQVLSPQGQYYVDPYWHLDQSAYVAYFKRDLVRTTPWQCLNAADQITPIDQALASSGDGGGTPLSLDTINGTQLKSYDLACAATGEYTAFFGGTVPLGQAAIVTAVNRVTGVYENEMAIRLTLVANNSNLVFTNSITDPYTNNNGSAMLSQNQLTVDSVIGNANYDIGHVFSTGGGGIAQLGVVGATGAKARGVTGSGSPTGDAFWIDYVAHEMGHQFGATHTFNSSSGGCGGNRTASTAYETGSGSTIMAYAGLCGGDDLQSNSDAYFHTASLDQILNYVSAGNGLSSATVTATGNTPPSVSVPASGATIPANTPFQLTMSGSDANGDAITYQWEERDLGPSITLSTPDNGSSPLFRSFSPTTNPTRYLRKLSDQIANINPFNGEQYPNTNRSLAFRAIVRDNRSGGGGINTADLFINVANTGSAFAVTSPNTSTTYNTGGPLNVAWNVANTTASPINTANVRILLSTDGGNTFPTVLSASTANDGAETVTLPAVLTNTARIKVEAIGNFFYDFSNVNFAIQVISNPTATPALAPGSDTGTSGSDRIINLNNSSPGSAISFDVGGTVAGSTVSIYADGNLIGSAPAGGATTTVVTNGSSPLADGAHTITARQTEPGKPQSVDSAPLSITIDTVAPQLSGTPSFSFDGTDTLSFTFNSDIGAGINNASLVLNNLSTSTVIPSGTIALSYSNPQANFTFPGQPNGRLPDGSYSATLTATDVAGNEVVGAGLPYNFIYVGGTTAHTIYVQRNGANVEVFKDTAPDGTPDHVALYSTLSQIALDGSSGNDTTTVDFVGGNPVPPGFLTFRFIGGAGNDVFNVKNPGTFYFDMDPLVDSQNLTVNVTDGATVEFGAIRVHLDGLNIDSGGTVNIPQAGFILLVARSLSISGGGKLDLNDNEMIVNYSGASPYGTVAGYINSARNGGDWLGSGVTSSSARTHPQGTTMMGAMEASDYKSIYGAGATFQSEPIDNTAVLIKYTYYGDSDFNGQVDFDDYVRIDGGYNLNLSGWLNGDFDLSGAIDFDDYVLIDFAYNLPGPPL